MRTNIQNRELEYSPLQGTWDTSGVPNNDGWGTLFPTVILRE